MTLPQGTAEACAGCGAELVDDGPPSYDYQGRTLCMDCVDHAIEKSGEAEAWAARCVVVCNKNALAAYDPEARSAPTREEYAAGAREAHTENAVRAHNRHNATNYDELKKDLDRYDPLDRARYAALCDRVGEEIANQLDALEESDLDDVVQP